jgi:hypothetical protein
VYWAVGKLRVVEQNLAKCNILIDSDLSSICTVTLNLLQLFIKFRISVFTISYSITPIIGSK